MAFLAKALPWCLLALKRSSWLGIEQGLLHLWIWSNMLMERLD